MTEPQQSLAERLGGAVTSVQFIYFLMNTNHSIEDYTAANGVVPANLREQLRGLVPTLIQFGIISEEQIQSMKAEFVEGLDAESIIEMFNDNLTLQTFTNLYNNSEELQDAIQTAFQERINTTALGQALTEFAGIELDRQQFGTGDGNLLDLTIGEITPERLDEIFVGVDGADPVMGTEQMEYILLNLPAEQAREAITSLGMATPEGGGTPIPIADFPVIEIAENATREDIQAAMNQALDARAEYELGQTSWVSQRFADAAGWVGFDELDRNAVLDSPELRSAVASGFAEMLSGFQDVSPETLLPARIHEFISQNRETDEHPEGEAMALLTENLEEIRAALNSNNQSLELFINLLPDDEIDSIFVSQVREFAQSNPIVQMIFQFVGPILNTLQGSFPSIFGGIDVVAAAAENPEPELETAGGVDPALTVGGAGIAP